MNTSLILTFVWLVAANALGMIPSRDDHWTRAYVLMALGLPLLAWVFWQNGPWIGLLALAAGASVLRWPVRYMFRWVRGVFGRVG